MTQKNIVLRAQREGYSAFYDKEAGTSVPTIIIKKEEATCVLRAVEDFATDWERVTGERPTITNEMPTEKLERAIFIGTLGSSSHDLLVEPEVKQQLIGKWEASAISWQKNPIETIEEAIFITGSDPRGTIFAMYEISEQMGVSPWHWWLDVPIKKTDQLFFSKATFVQDEPSVKYRGFFINDEGPSLMTWARKKFGDLNAEFYEKVFELTLRLKANYHWPAMWDSSFYEDDPSNAEVAHRYGVVMGTSHHEPMARPHKDWKTHRNGAWSYETNAQVLDAFWKEGIQRSKPYETILTMGMRGDGDEAMESELSFHEKMKLMEDILANQRALVTSVHEKSAEEVPQLFALYKEVMEYYEAGMKVPEDVTLLWSDDNFGNLRRVPTKEERTRSGGAGMYYHLDYVGGPRSYKWVNTVPVQKIYEQMNKAYEYGADRIWILNVGDIKPMEYPMSFFFQYAWDVTSVTSDNVADYPRVWAEKTFGEEFADKIASILVTYTKMNGRIKPEHLNGGPMYALDGEGERELASFEEAVILAEEVMSQLNEEQKDAFFQAVYYPTVGSYQVLRMYYLAALNQKYAKEKRAATNRLAEEVRALFQKDEELTKKYHELAGGKWNDMMLQTHIGYTYWQQPEENTMPSVTEIELPQMGEILVETDAVTITIGWTKEFEVELVNTGKSALPYTLRSNVPWLLIEEAEGTVLEQKNVSVTIDSNLIKDMDAVEASITVTSKEQAFIIPVRLVRLPIDRQKGHIEINGVISIEAEQFVANRSADGATWTIIPGYGRTKSSLALLPNADTRDWDQMTHYPTVSYRFFTEAAGERTISLILAPSLDFVGSNGAPIGIRCNGSSMITLPSVNRSADQPDEREWEQSVIHNARHVQTLIPVQEGWNTLEISMLSPELVLQKVVITKETDKTFLGANESPFITTNE